VAYLERIGYLQPNLLAAHVNHLWRDDAATLARRQVHVVHCPRSHDYFRHAIFRARISNQPMSTFALGRIASQCAKIAGKAFELNLFAEMQMFAAEYPECHRVDPKKWPPSTVPERSDERAIGELASKACADVIVLPSREPGPCL